ncbi:hypothetical protein [Hydrogenophaga sp.]|jgi:hypothetical protein|nr:hypothetical protein [Hydrogenophaga sp.]
MDDSRKPSIGKIVVIVLAVFGGIAVLCVLGMVLMSFGMMGSMGC